MTFTNPVFDHVALDPSVVRDPNGVFWLLVWSEENSVKVALMGADGLRPDGPGRTVLLPIGEEGTGYTKRGRASVGDRARRAHLPLHVRRRLLPVRGSALRVAVSRASSPLELFERFPGSPILESNDGPWIAPGHCAVVRDDAGTDWMLLPRDAFDTSRPSGDAARSDRVA
jgi:arabinan endo-1,5-alpha-L-arabinosidase